MPSGDKLFEELKSDKLFEELKKYDIEDLYKILRDNGVDESIVWSLTKEETENDLKFNFGQSKRYWDARKKKDLNDPLASGGKVN